MIYVIYLLLFILMMSTLKNRHYVIFKALNSLGFIGIAIYGALQTEHLSFLYIMLPGLIGCLIGDVLLAIKYKKHFLHGLIAFLIANLCFVFYFSRFKGITVQEFFIPAIAMMILIGLSYLPKMNYGDYEKPVMCYTFVIAWAMSSSLVTYLTMSTMMFAMSFFGFSLYFLSDFILLFYKFYDCQHKDILGFLNLLSYYAGMFMIGYSLFL